MRLWPGALARWHCFAVLFIAVLCAYGGSLDHGLVGFDDTASFQGDLGGVAGLSEWKAQLRSDPLNAVLELFSRRQLTNASKLADLALFGDDWRGHHAMNVAYHLAAVWLAFMVAAALLGSTAGGLAAALIFALHPAQVESTAYLAGRRDVLSGLLGLLSFRLWQRSLENGGAGLKLTALASWVAALAAKPSAVTLPALWLAAAWARRPAEGLAGAWRRNRGLYLGLGAAAAVVVLFHWAEARRYEFRSPSETLWHGGSPLRQFATEPRVLLHALRLLVWPWKLCADNNGAFPPSGSFLDLRTIGACAVLLAMGALAWRLARRRPPMAFALAWIAATYAPMIHILPTAHNQQSFAEHWLYLPVFGAALLVAQAFLAVRRRAPAAAWAVLACLTIILGARSAARVQVWRDDLTFWTQAARDCPACAGPRQGLAEAWRIRGRNGEAERLLLEAVALEPADPRPRISLGALQLEAGRLDQAERTLRAAWELPMDRVAYTHPIQYNLALIELRRGRPRQALRRVQNFGSRRALHLSGYASFLLGDYDRAERLLRRVLLDGTPGHGPAGDPNDVSALSDLALVLLERGRYDEAVQPLERAATLAPRRADLLVKLGKVHTERKDFLQAHLRLTRAAHMTPDFAPAWIALSDLDLRRGFSAAAAASARRAVELENSTEAYRALAAALAVRPRPGGINARP